MVTKICSIQIPYSGVVFICVDTLYSRSFFCEFYIHLADFFPHIESKMVCTLIKHSVISSIQYTLAFITSFFEGMFSQSTIFYENNMILWYIRSGQQWSGKCMVHGFMDVIPRTKTKTLPLRKLRVGYFFHAVYYSKNHVIPHSVIAAILNAILNILQR